MNLLRNEELQFNLEQTLSSTRYDPHKPMDKAEVVNKVNNYLKNSNRNLSSKKELSDKVNTFLAVYNNAVKNFLFDNEDNRLYLVDDNIMEYSISVEHTAFDKMVQHVETYNDILLPLLFLSYLYGDNYLARFGFKLNRENTLDDFIYSKINSYLYLHERNQVDSNSPYGLINTLIYNHDFLIEFIKDNAVKTDIVKLAITNTKEKGTKYSNGPMRTIRFTLFLKDKSNYDRIYDGNSVYLYRFDSNDVESVDFSISVPGQIKFTERSELKRLNGYLTIVSKLLTKVLRDIKLNDYTYINSLVEKFRALKFNWHDVRGDNYEKDTCNYILEHLELY